MTSGFFSILFTDLTIPSEISTAKWSLRWSIISCNYKYWCPFCLLAHSNSLCDLFCLIWLSFIPSVDSTFVCVRVKSPQPLDNTLASLFTSLSLTIGANLASKYLSTASSYWLLIVLSLICLRTFLPLASCPDLLRLMLLFNNKDPIRSDSIRDAQLKYPCHLKNLLMWSINLGFVGRSSHHTEF